MNNDLQNFTQKIKDRATRTPLKTWVNPDSPGMVRSSCSTCKPFVLLLLQTLFKKPLIRKAPNCDYDKWKISCSSAHSYSMPYVKFLLK